MIVIPSLEIGGGAEKNAYSLAAKFSNSYSVKFLTFYDLPNQHDTKQEIFCLGEKPKKNLYLKLVYLFKRLAFIKGKCKSYKPDLVISFGFYSNILVSLASLIRNYKVILSVRSDIFKQSNIIKNLSCILYNRMDAIHVVTKKMHQNLSSLGINNITQIYNGHNIERYIEMAEHDLEIEIPEAKFVYLNIGRLSYPKGQWHLLKAFSLCVKDYPDSILIIIGEGELREKLCSLAQSLGIEDKVIMVGNTANIFPYIKRSDCFCFTSLYEGLPNVLIETLSIGRPIISTDCISGPREIIFPELVFDEELTYPFKSNGYFLSAPFEISNVDTTRKLNQLEIKYSNLMEEARSINKNISNQSIQLFSENKILKQWVEFIDDLCST